MRFLPYFFLFSSLPVGFVSVLPIIYQLRGLTVVQNETIIKNTRLLHTNPNKTKCSSLLRGQLNALSKGKEHAHKKMYSIEPAQTRI